MLRHRPHASLPSADLGWLKARHHFRVDGAPDPVHAPIKSLYIWNDDWFAAASGFPMHFHRDVEILTYVRSGSVTHQDILGNTSELRQGDVQVMTAGTGIRHAEFNRGSETLKLFQIWFEPDRKGCEPAYAMRRFPDLSNRGNWVTLASGLPEADDSKHLPMAAPARVLGCHVGREQRVLYPVRERHDLYAVVSRGEMLVNGLRLGEGDGVAVSDETELRFEALSDADVVVAEMA
jgi:hypothetical protein